MIGTDISHAVRILREGGIVGVPTETVYGLAAVGILEEAVLKIFEAKGRPHFDPLILHFDGIESARPYLREVPIWAQLLYQHFSPGPISFLLEKTALVPDLVTAGLPRVAIRFPDHAVLQDLLTQLQLPLAAPSANPFGYISPTTAEHVEAQLGSKIDYILDGGPCDIGVESTIIGEEEGQLIVYRKGGIPIEDITAIVGPVKVMERSSSNPVSPGLLLSHYAPRTPLRVLNEETFSNTNKGNFGYIIFGPALEEISMKDQYLLSPKRDIKEAAKNLFKCMREADAGGHDQIFIHRVPNHGLGPAINDRIQRALHSGDL